jgi:hypothetical protein
MKRGVEAPGPRVAWAGTSGQLVAITIRVARSFTNKPKVSNSIKQE